MSKILAFCADGTWDNTGSNTNVHKLANAIQNLPGVQIFKYDSGVGADGLPLEHLAGGAFGLGLDQKIKDGYTFFCNHYAADDELFLFGFSRGAYTARALAGMIAICGLPTNNPDSHLVDTAFSAYRSRDANQRAELLKRLEAPYGMYNAQIKMVGVWDTVGSLGIPAIFGGVSPLLYGFIDTNLHEDVRNAYHAVAIDEKRMEFPATLWTSAPVAGQTIEQVYFSGCHGDVGGGNTPGSDDSGTLLSDITLGWMMGHARALGLNLDPATWGDYASLDAHYSLDDINQTWKVFWLFPKSRNIAGNASLGNSVAIRCGHTPGYHPGNLKFDNNALLPNYQIVRVVNDPPQN